MIVFLQFSMGKSMQFHHQHFAPIAGGNEGSVSEMSGISTIESAT